MLFESNSQKHFSRIFFQNGKSWDDYAYAHHNPIHKGQQVSDLRCLELRSAKVSKFPTCAALSSDPQRTASFRPGGGGRAAGGGGEGEGANQCGLSVPFLGQEGTERDRNGKERGRKGQNRKERAERDRKGQKGTERGGLQRIAKDCKGLQTWGGGLQRIAKDCKGFQIWGGRIAKDCKGLQRISKRFGADFKKTAFIVAERGPKFAFPVSVLCASETC